MTSLAFIFIFHFLRCGYVHSLARSAYKVRCIVERMIQICIGEMMKYEICYMKFVSTVFNKNDEIVVETIAVVWLVRKPCEAVLSRLLCPTTLPLFCSPFVVATADSLRANWLRTLISREDGAPQSKTLTKAKWPPTTGLARKPSTLPSVVSYQSPRG